MKPSEIQAIKTIGESENLDFLVIILELSAQMCGVDTVSEMARKHKISPNGVKNSSRFKKLKIGKQQMAVFGSRECGLPF